MIWLLRVMLLAPLSLFAQVETVQLLDADTKEPLAFATIQFAPGQGVISNEEGYFQIPGQTQVEALSISCLGYESLLLPYPLEKRTIHLTPKAVQLDEVLLQDRYPTGKEIMSRVRSRLGDNHRPTDLFHKVFSRETSSMDFEELSFEVDKASRVSRETLENSNAQLQQLADEVRSNKTLYYTDYLGEVHQVEGDSLGCLKIIKATELLDADRNYNADEIEERMKKIVFQYLDTTRTYKFKSGLFTLEKSMDLDDFKEEAEDTLPPTLSVKGRKSRLQRALGDLGTNEEGWLWQLSDSRNYEFQLQGITSWNSRNVYRVSFRPDRGKAKFRGEFLIDMEDYGIHFIRYAYGEGKRGSKFNLKLLLGVKFIEDRKEGVALFRRDDTTGYLPHYYSASEGAYVYVGRPFSFISNEGRKQKIKCTFRMGGNTFERTELLFSRSTTMRTATECDTVEKVPLTRLSKYDPTLWGSEEVLQPLQEMKDFGL